MDPRIPPLFRVVNGVDRLATPVIVTGVNRVLPVVARVGQGRGWRCLRNLPYVDRDGLRLAADVYLPPSARPGDALPVVVGFHGGAWTLGRKENLAHQGAAFARAGLVAVLVQYRLAPRHPWPACGEDVADALAWVRSRAEAWGGDGRRVGVFGDSAGGHLSAWAAVLGRRQRDDLPEIAAATHWYGVFDFERFARVPYHRTPQIMRNLFGPDWQEAPELVSASPLRQLDPVAPPPPTLLLAGTRDPLLGQSRRYAEALDRRGVALDLVEYRGSVHGFANLWWQRDARDALRRSVDWFGRHLVGARS